MLVIGGPNGVSGAVVGAVLVTALREVLRSIENNVNMSKILPSGLVGFTEIVMAVLLIVILILRPGGIMGGRELRWPLWKRPAGKGADGGTGSTGV
jgi:branched-chain amino acid transport system permease protein